MLPLTKNKPQRAPMTMCTRQAGIERNHSRNNFDTQRMNGFLRCDHCVLWQVIFYTVLVQSYFP